MKARKPGIRARGSLWFTKGNGPPSPLRPRRSPDGASERPIGNPEFDAPHSAALAGTVSPGAGAESTESSATRIRFSRCSPSIFRPNRSLT